MRFFHIILISFLLMSCGPSSGQMTATAAMAKTQTHEAALTITPAQGSTATHTPTASPPTTETSTPSRTPLPDGDPVLVGAGDISSCNASGDEATADLLDDIPGTVFTTGDNAYPDGAPAEFANCYDPSWGRHKARTYPSAGNHDYHTTDAAGYFSYFGPVAGDPAKGYYSYDLGTWHIVVLNSSIPVDAGSPQEQWLRADLAAHPVACTAAYWHHPRFSSGTVHGSNSRMQPLWQALYDYGADVVLAGHEHNYERFAPQDPNGNADPAKGITQFVVGSGGRSHYEFGIPIANSEVRNSDTYGVLKLTLHSTAYDWEFVPEAGKTFTDSGSASCVGSGTSASSHAVTPTIAPSQVLTFAPVDDATVKADSPDDNFGSAITLNTDNDTLETFLLKFAVFGVNGRTVKSAILRLYNVNSSDQGGNFYPVADNTWSETKLTWSTLPAAEPAILASLGPVSADTWYEVDLTSLITEDGTFSILVSSSSSNGADYTSKEGAAGFNPQLIVSVYE